MSRSPWLVLVSSFAVAITIMAGPARAEQPALTPSASPAPLAAPDAPAQPPAPAPQPDAQPPAPAPQPDAQPQAGPPITSEYPRLPLPPVASRPAAAPVLPRGTMAPGATPVLPPPAPAPKRYERYPLTVMIADVAWLVASVKLESPGLFLGGYVGAAPLAHLLMGNTRSAWISAGLRAGAVAFTAVTAINAFSSDCYDCEAEAGLVVAGVLGAATIMVVDWMVLAKKEVPAAVPVPPRDAPAWVVTPQVQVGQGGLQLGVGGWF
jgi:hypothetical protein